jgi:hypothetical protein
MQSIILQNIEWQLLYFIQVFVTPTHLAIVLEYAAGGELFTRLCTAGRFSEIEVQIYYPFSPILFIKNI